MPRGGWEGGQRQQTKPRRRGKLSHPQDRELPEMDLERYHLVLSKFPPAGGQGHVDTNGDWPKSK